MASTPIPKHVHFISLNRPFSFMEWLAVVSARKKIKPDKITVYTDGQQDSCWWRRALPYIEHQLIHTIPGASVLNNAHITQWAHKADFLRLSILYQYGGIYMDMDSLTYKSLDPLLQHQVVLGKECSGMVNVAVMMAQKHSCFFCKFAHVSCKSFKGTWIAHSVAALDSYVKGVNKEENDIKVIRWIHGGFYPMCWNSKGLDDLFKKDYNTFNKTDIYTVHLFQNRAKNLFPTTLHSFRWIQESKSLAALTIRDSLPPDFSEKHLDTSSECSDISL